MIPARAFSPSQSSHCLFNAAKHARGYAVGWSLQHSSFSLLCCVLVLDAGRSQQVHFCWEALGRMHTGRVHSREVGSLAAVTASSCTFCLKRQTHPWCKKAVGRRSWSSPTAECPLRNFPRFATRPVHPEECPGVLYLCCLSHLPLFCILLPLQYSETKHFCSPIVLGSKLPHA